MGFPDDDITRKTRPHVTIGTQDRLRKHIFVAEQQYLFVEQNVTLGNLGGVGMCRGEARRQEVHGLPRWNARTAIEGARHIGRTNLALLMKDNSVWEQGERATTVCKGAPTRGVQEKGTRTGDVQLPTTARELNQV